VWPHTRDGRCLDGESTERELTSDELDAVSGGADSQFKESIQIDSWGWTGTGGGGGGSDNTMIGYGKAMAGPPGGPPNGPFEEIMSKTKDTSKFDHAKLENRVLADSDLDAVSGGFWNFAGVFALPRPTPNVTVNGGPLAFVAPLVARS